MQAQGAGTWPSPPVYIDDVFNTYLYTGNSATQTITNGINLSANGGLVWSKARSIASSPDLVTTPNFCLLSNATLALQSDADVTTFNTNGYSLRYSGGRANTSGTSYVSWTFREQPKFFDIVTYTGTGANTTIAHSLGSVPGCMIVKRTDVAADWQVYHSSLANTQYVVLNGIDPATTGATRWNSTTPTSSVFSIGTDTTVNASGGTYVAYLFASNAGGFGLTGADNVITCGTYTGNGTTQNVTLGYEPQFIFSRMTDGTTESAAQRSWRMIDVWRGMPVNLDSFMLLANSNAAENSSVDSYDYNPTATGFTVLSQANNSGKKFIYVAIRRPMKPPALGTDVFGISATTGTGANATVTGGTLPDDAVLIKNRGSAVGDLFASRLTLRGYLETSSNLAAVTAGVTILQANPWDVMDGVKVGTTSTITNASANTFINYLFSRAPGFFDVVCYTGVGAAGATAIAHNLTVVPQMMIVKARSDTRAWGVYQSTMANTDVLYLESTQAKDTAMITWGNTTPTSTQFYVGNTFTTNGSGVTYIAYLFATFAGISKVGSYTGTAALLTVDCGFTSGARWVMIKRSDSTGDWYYWDSTRGITSGTDPYLLMNSTAAEVTGTNYVDTDTTGFKVTAAAPAGLNAVGGNYIFLAIA
jgi:hypothetical protein